MVEGLFHIYLYVELYIKPSVIIACLQSLALRLNLHVVTVCNDGRVECAKWTATE
jgi:hypothetical protein